MPLKSSPSQQSSFKVLITDGLDPSGIDLLKTHSEIQVVLRESSTPEQLAQLVPQYDAILIRSKTKISASLIQNSSRLKLIVSCAIGMDQVNLQAAKEAGIQVMNCPTANALSAAEHTLGLIFALTRNIAHSHLLIHQKKWERGNSLQGVELHQKILGIIGVGNIGRIVAEKAMALGMQVIAYDLKPPHELKLPEKFKYLENRFTLARSMQEVLKRADILTLHIPKNEKNLGLIGENEIMLMPSGGFLINCARGGIVQEEALLKALCSKHLQGAALDVFETEPLDFEDATTQALLSHPRVVMTSHLGGNTKEAQARIGIQAAQNVLYFLNQKGKTFNERLQ